MKVLAMRYRFIDEVIEIYIVASHNQVLGFCSLISSFEATFFS
jgi:hypothetical protein